EGRRDPAEGGGGQPLEVLRCAVETDGAALARADPFPLEADEAALFTQPIEGQHGADDVDGALVRVAGDVPTQVRSRLLRGDRVVHRRAGEFAAEPCEELLALANEAEQQLVV